MKTCTFLREDEADVTVTVPDDAVEVRLCPDGAILVILAQKYNPLDKLLDGPSRADIDRQTFETIAAIRGE